MTNYYLNASRCILLMNGSQYEWNLSSFSFSVNYNNNLTGGMTQDGLNNIKVQGNKSVSWQLTEILAPEDSYVSIADYLAQNSVTTFTIQPFAIDSTNLPEQHTYTLQNVIINDGGVAFNVDSASMRSHTGSASDVNL